MRKIFAITLIVIFTVVSYSLPFQVDAKTRVKSYTKKSGKYVAPHYRTSPNKVKYDNWSSKGNYNPYTGKKGYKKLY